MAVDIPDHLVGRWVVDRLDPDGPRIPKFLLAGWSFWDGGKTVSGKDWTVGEEGVDANNHLGSVKSKQVNRDGSSAYLMVIEREYYEAVQKDKQDMIDEAERDIYNETQADGNYGELNQKIESFRR
jgi:hypothetical protein